jgi:DNA polymerase elongation subunit (family B)
MIGRLHCHKLKEITRRNISSKIRQLTSGRLLVDTYLSSKDMIKANDYTLSHLCETFLNIKYEPIQSDMTKDYLGTAESIANLVQNSQLEAKYAMEVMLKL